MRQTAGHWHLSVCETARLEMWSANLVSEMWRPAHLGSRSVSVFHTSLKETSSLQTHVSQWSLIKPRIVSLDTTNKCKSTAV